jgi:hypothetical protein
MLNWLKNLFSWRDTTSYKAPVPPVATEEDAKVDEAMKEVMAKVKEAAAKPRVSKPAAMKPKAQVEPTPVRKSPNVLPKAAPVATTRKSESSYVAPIVSSPTDLGSVSNSKVDSSDYSGGGGSSSSWDSSSDSGSSSSSDGGGGSGGRLNLCCR